MQLMCRVRKIVLLLRISFMHFTEIFIKCLFYNFNLCQMDYCIYNTMEFRPHNKLGLQMLVFV